MRYILYTILLATFCLFPTTAQGTKAVINTNGPGNLSSIIAQTINDIDTLSVLGEINEIDFETIWKCAFYGRLAYLDLEKAIPADNQIPAYAFFHPEVQSVVQNGFVDIIPPANLKTVILPASVTKIGSNAFAYTNIEKCVLPENLTLLESYAFYKSSLSGTLDLPANLIEIGNRCFTNCEYIDKVICQSSLQEIGIMAFYECKFSEIEFSEGLRKIGVEAFAGNPILKEVVLPSSVTTLGSASFANCFALERIELSEGIEFIPIEFAELCTSLKSITIPSSVLSIGEKAFYWCKSLNSINFNEGLCGIGPNAFQYCPVETLVLPSTIKGMDHQSFGDNTHLKAIYSHATEAPWAHTSKINTATITDLPDECNAFSGTTPFDIPVYIPVGSLKSYRRDTSYGWKRFTNIIELSDMPPFGGTDQTVVTTKTIEIVAATGGIILRGDLIPGTPFMIYTSDGRKAAEGRLSDTEIFISLSKGIYVVTAGTSVKKLAI